MERYDRVIQLTRILNGRRTPVTRAELERRLECSRATVQRVIEYARNYLNAPIVYDRERNGYCYAAEQQGVYELPGLWFTAAETQALLTLMELLDAAQPGLLTQALAPLRERIEALARHHAAGGPEFARRIRILASAPRIVDLDTFRQVAGAVVKRRHPRALPRPRARPEHRALALTAAPCTRSNWYLDAGATCALRSFALDRLRGGTGTTAKTSTIHVALSTPMPTASSWAGAQQYCASPIPPHVGSRTSAGVAAGADGTADSGVELQVPWRSPRAGDGNSALRRGCRVIGRQAAAAGGRSLRAAGRYG